MPNIGSVLKEEIIRLSRKESRSQIDPTKRATIRQRREVAELKRQVAQLARQVALLSRKTLGAPAVVPADDNGKPARFSAKGLRVQRERMDGNYVPSTREYYHFFGLDDDKLSQAKPDALIMHPGPMNRGVEIASTIADHSRSVIRDQVEMGVAVRMAVLEALARNLPNH